MHGWHVFALTAAALFLKQAALVMVQLFGRLRSKSFRHEEDAKLFKGKAGDSELAKRGQSAINNALENEPIFLALLFAFFAIHSDGEFRPHADYVDAARIYAQVFVGARIVHALLMLARIGGLRTLAFTTGFLATLGLAIQILSDVL